MALLNYTTTISVEKTLGEVHALLAKHRARSILTEYDDAGQPLAVSFQMQTARGLLGYRLPIDMEATWKVLSKQNAQGKVARRFVAKEQAARVGWRIVKDWLEAQLALIETEMVTMDQVLLPYQLINRNQTVYEALVGGQLALPAGERDAGAR